MRTIFVTGGAGFIGSNFLLAMVHQQPDIVFVNIDKLTYAGNLRNLDDLAGCANYHFAQVDITQRDVLHDCFLRYQPDALFHFAAESHVDRGITGPAAFIETNILGTFHLLEECRLRWHDSAHHLFHHVSTDEVYGSLGATGAFDEAARYDPSNPYSASKASSDHLVMAYHRTFGLPVLLTHCSNNYGPRQHPEKLVPSMILRACAGQPLPIYGNGHHVRDWVYVEDHCRALWTLATRGRPGETYNIGGEAARDNVTMVRTLCRLVAEETGKSPGDLEALITFVSDRPGHDFRYAMDTRKIRAAVAWTPSVTIEEGLRRTVRWYLEHPDWVAAAAQRSEGVNVL